MVHQLPKLEYKYDALEPYFDKETMELHYSKHHQAYVDKLNAALEGHPELQKKSAEDLLKVLDKVPEAIRTAVKNHGGGHWNHSFWWPMLKKNVKCSGDIEAGIKKKWGSVEKFKEELTKASLGVFGSGWAWGVVDAKGNLEIVTTPNQDCPLSEGKHPVLGVDVWEHSYYVKYRNRRNEYLEAFFKVINWDAVNNNLKKAKGK